MTTSETRSPRGSKASDVTLSIKSIPRGFRNYASCAACLPTRYVLTFQIFCGMCLESCHRLCLSVAIVAMVNSTSVVPTMHNTTDSYCPSTEAEEESRDYRKGEYDWSPTVQGVILGAYFYGLIFTPMVGGRLAEVLGGKWLLGGSILLGSILTLATPAAAELGVTAIIASRVIMGLAHGTCTPSAYAMTANWAPAAEKSTLICLWKAGVQVGAILSLPLIGFLCEHGFAGGWPSVYYVLGMIGCVWFCFWCILAYENPADHPRISDKELEYIRRGQENVVDQKKMNLPWRSVFSSLAVWSTAVAMFASGWGYYIVQTKVPSYMEFMLHISITKSTTFITVGQILGASTQFLSGYVTDLLISKKYFTATAVRKTFQIIAMAGCTITTSLLPTSGCNYRAAAAALLSGSAFGGMTGGSEATIFMDMAPQFVGTITGLALGLSYVSGILAPLVAGLLLDDEQRNVGQWSLLFYVSAGMYILSGVIFAIGASAELQPWATGENRKKDTEKEAA